MKENRKSIRLTVDIPVKIRFNGITMPGMGRNLSCGGIFIQSPDDPPVTESCEVVIQLPDGRGPMKLQSEKIWQAPNIDDLEGEEALEGEADDRDSEVGTGFHFDSLDADQKARINQFIIRNIREDIN